MNSHYPLGLWTFSLTLKHNTAQCNTYLKIRVNQKRNQNTRKSLHLTQYFGQYFFMDLGLGN